MEQVIPEPLALDPEAEKAVRKRLRAHFEPDYRERVNDYLEMLLSLDGCVDRFLYIRNVLSGRADVEKSSVLISGFSAGSEMIAARQFGYAAIYGVEVEPIYLDACKMRLRGFSDMYPSLYDGENLPYEPDKFDLIASGHIVEHTRDPGLYLNELMRIAKPGGHIFLEFPTRYHTRELHTGLPSFEWLPRVLRNRILHIISAGFSPLAPDVKTRYRSILGTGLQQVSFRMITSALRRSGWHFEVVHKVMPAPGVVRCILKKNQAD